MKKNLLQARKFGAPKGWLKGAFTAVAASALLAACTPTDTEQGEFVDIDRDPFPSSYTPLPSGTTLITGATILDGKGGRIENGSILMEGGKVVAVGTDVSAPDGATVIDAAGRWVTP